MKTPAAPETPPAGAPPPAPAGTPPAPTTTTPPAPAAPPAAIELKWPEGYKADAKLVGSFTTWASKHGLDGAKMQEFATEFATAQTAQHKAALEAAEAQLVKEQDGWRESIKTDKELGGPNFEATKVALDKALAKFGTPELRKMLDDTGMGDHPEVVRTFARIGKLLSEGKLVGSEAAPGTSEADLLKKAFPNTKHLHPQG